MSQVTVRSQYHTVSLGSYDSRADALLAIARYILMATPVHVSIQLKREGNTLSVYRVHKKLKGRVRQFVFTKEMEFTIS